MKQLPVIVLLLLSVISKAQVVIEPNPSYTSSSEKPVLDEWLDVESLDGRAEPAMVNPSEKICFDKRMLVKANTPMGNGYSCIYINTKIGLVGYTGITKAMPGCELDIDDINFNFNIIGLKGTHFNYFNSRRKGVLRHHLVASNTHRQGLAFSAVALNEPLHRKDEQKEFFGKVKAWEYKANGRTESWWIFGKTLPEKLVAQPKKYLGLFGVGYQFAEQGMFIILQLSGAGSYGFEAEALELKDIPTCFNSNLFSVFEETELVQAQENMQEATDRLEQRIRENASSVSPCKELKEKSLKQQKKMADVKKIQIQQMSQGRTTESLSSQVEYEIENTQMMADNAEEEICKVTDKIAKATSESTRQRLIQRKKCLLLQLPHFQQLVIKFKNAQKQYPRRPAQALQSITQIKLENRFPHCP